MFALTFVEHVACTIIGTCIGIGGCMMIDAILRNWGKKP